MSALNLPILLEGEDKDSPFKNRIRKNYQHLRKWGKRSQTDCFRIFDRDIKEYPLAIDFYAGRFCVQLFSFNEPREDLLEETSQILCSLFGISSESIYQKTRFKRKKTEQYEKQGEGRDFFIVYEYGAQFKINLSDYLDTGLFLDHRETRQWVASLAAGKSLLNLFAYTCSFSIHAALQGACYTTSVDLSNTYTEWGRENFLINQIDKSRHTIIRADCLKFLEEEHCKKKNYDLIVLDPPTLSRSKKMESFFEIQKDYPQLLKKALRLLATGGTLFFSTNARRFLFDPQLLKGYVVEEITQKTQPSDFRHKIHRCWQITAS